MDAVPPPPDADASPALEAAGRLVARARRAAGPWAEAPLRTRVRALEAAAKDLLVRRDDVVAAMEADTGKNPLESLLSEALGPLDQVRQWARLFRRVPLRRRVRLSPLTFPGKRAWVELRPRGVVGAITPWNYPLGVFFRPVLPALLAGNGVVIKPSEHAPRTARLFVERLAAHLPEDLVGLLPGGPEAGRALLDAGIDALAFTGSVTAGREIARRAGERHIVLSAELGGNDAAIVLEDCDLVRTAAGVTHWALHNAGQNCGAIERLFVLEGIADALLDRLAAAWERLRVGPGPPVAVDVSPLAHEDQLAVVERHVADARARGAHVRTGGRRVGTGLGYAPTLLEGCTDEMAVMREETFGPVLATSRVASVEEAIDRANTGIYGLGASVWTGDLARGRHVAARLDTGVASINNHAVSGAIVALPWTGTRCSGPGVANSVHALGTFLRPRTLLVDGGRKPDPFWVPHDADLQTVADAVGGLMTGRPGGLPRLLAAAGRRARTIRQFFSDGM